MNILDKIHQFKLDANKREQEAIQKKVDEHQALVNEVLSLKGDIVECMKICRACVESGIPINNYEYGMQVNTETTFATDSWHHRVGYKNRLQFGCEGGGACGEFAGVEFNEDLTKMKVIDPEGEDYKLRSIVSAFKKDNFKGRLEAYVESYINSRSKRK